MKRVLYTYPREIILVTRVVFVWAIMSFSIGCLQVSKVNFDEDRQSAVNSTNDFHSMFNDRRFEDIYEMTDQLAKESKSKDGLIAILTALRNERGRVIQSDLIDAKIETRSTYREVRLSFRTKFENTETVERFVWYVSDKKAGLFSYASD